MNINNAGELQQIWQERGEEKEGERGAERGREGQREGGRGKEGAASSLLALRCSCNASNESKTFNSMMSGQPTQCVRGTEAAGGKWEVGDGSASWLECHADWGSQQ